MKYTFLIIGLLLMCFFCEAQVKTLRPEAAALRQLKNNFSKMVHYPPKETEDRVFGKVVMCFTVNKDKAVTSMTILKSLSAGCDQEVKRILTNLSSRKKIDLQEGTYSLAVNYKLLDDGKLLEEKSKKLRQDKGIRFLFTVDLVNEMPRTRTHWIVDRWPQANFSGDVRGNVRSMTVSQYCRVNGADSLLWKLKFEPPVSNAMKPVPVKGSRLDTLTEKNGGYNIRKFNSRGQLIVSSTYKQDHFLERKHEYRYKRDRCVEDKCTLYSAKGDPFVMVDQFAYDKDGRKVKENYGVNDQKITQQITYQYTDWDEHGNWQSAIRTDADKVSHIVKRTLVY